MCVGVAFGFPAPRGGAFVVKCVGSDCRLPRVHITHDLWRVGLFLVCFRCGRYAREKVVGLGSVCVKPDPKDYKCASHISSWVRGVHPVLRRYVGDPKAVSQGRRPVL